jgi:two-component system sensor histidine kinase KdpD
MATREFCRPDPEELLRKIEAEEAQARRGRLKIFLGYAPRVGKSFRMFDEGRRRAERGQDVVVGAVQIKGSEDLAPLLTHFEIIPFAVGGGIDVEAILCRAPQACLIDQLASNNPPGSPREHRWQDVEALLEHGINVISAINLQYIAELQPEIEKVTGRRANSSVPQGFIRSADEIVVVDVPPEDLHNDGDHSRSESSLTARQLSNLRELALLLAAEVVESQLQRYMDAHGIRQSWGTQERILVCMTPRSEARAMLQTGRYSADRFHGHLMAVYVKQKELTREAEETLEQNLELARRLGAEVNVLEGMDPMGEIIKFAREQRVTQIFVGHTQRSSWRFWTANPVDRLIEAAEGIDVRIFPHSRNPVI